MAEFQQPDQERAVPPAQVSMVVLPHTTVQAMLLARLRRDQALSLGRR